MKNDEGPEDECESWFFFFFFIINEVMKEAVRRSLLLCIHNGCQWLNVIRLLKWKYKDKV